MRLFIPIKFLIQSVNNFARYAMNNPITMMISLVLMQARLAQAEDDIQVFYLTYPLNANSTLPLTERADSHIVTAVMHAVHTGLLFALANGTFYELHYGQHKWNKPESNQEVFEYVNSHYPNHWLGNCCNCGADVTENYNQTELEIWLNQHSVGDVLFNYLPMIEEWRGYIITNSDREYETKLIDIDSSTYKELDQINHLQKNRPGDISYQTLTNYIRREKLFGPYTPFCWKGHYEIAPLPSYLTYPDAKKIIFEQWNNTKYIFGIHDCWEMIIWFSKEYLKVSPEKLGGPLGTYVNSPGHALRNIGKLSHWLIYDRNFTHIDPEDYFNDISDSMENFFDTLKKETRNSLHGLANSNLIQFLAKNRYTNILLVLIKLIYFSTPYILFSSLVYAINNKIFRRQNKKNPLYHEVDVFLNWLGKQVSGPKEYHGTLMEGELKSGLPHMNYQQEVDRIPPAFSKFICQSEQFKFDDPDSNGFFAYLFSPYKQRHPIKEIAFFIPGTASSLHNKAICDTITSHLVNALNMPVIAITHRVAPYHRWPILFYDVYQTIIFFYKKYNEPNLVLTGYSSGGYYATLATLMLSKNKIKVNRLLLFAPLLDISGEFAYKKNQEEKYYKRYIPPELEISYPDYQKIYQDSQQDKLFDDHKFNDIITKCYPNNFLKNPRLLRGCSPAWISISALKNLSYFPETTIITGDLDYFKMDSIIFYKKLVAAKKTCFLFLLPQKKHDVFWIHLFPIYLSQFVTANNGEFKNNLTRNYQKLEDFDKKLALLYKEQNNLQNEIRNIKKELKETKSSRPSRLNLKNIKLGQLESKDKSIQKDINLNLDVIKFSCRALIQILKRNSFEFSSSLSYQFAVDEKPLREGKSYERPLPGNASSQAGFFTPTIGLRGLSNPAANSIPSTPR